MNYTKAQQKVIDEQLAASDIEDLDYCQFNNYNDTVTLDGHYSIKELEAIVAIMKKLKELEK